MRLSFTLTLGLGLWFKLEFRLPHMLRVSPTSISSLQTLPEPLESIIMNTHSSLSALDPEQSRAIPMNTSR